MTESRIFNLGNEGERKMQTKNNFPRREKNVKILELEQNKGKLEGIKT